MTNNCQAVVSVTGLADGRRLMVKADTKNKADEILSQDGLPLNVETEYALSFDAQADTFVLPSAYTSNRRNLP